MSALAARAELLKLADQLELTPVDLDYLDGVEAEQLRVIRVSITELLFDDEGGMFARLGRWVAKLPARSIAMLAPRMGPLLTARVAAELPPQFGARIAARLDPSFLADAAVDLDVRRARDLVRLLPKKHTVAVAVELAARRDFITMSQFVDALTDDVIRAVEEAIDDEADLLRVVFYMESKNRIDHLFRMLPVIRIQRLITRVQEEPEALLADFLSLLVHVTFASRRDLGDIVAAQDPAILAGYVRGAHEQGLWPDVLPVVASMSVRARRNVVNLEILREHDVQSSILLAAQQHHQWGIVLPMIEGMEPDNRSAVAAILTEMGPAALQSAGRAALVGEHWDTLLDLVRQMPDDSQTVLIALIRDLGETDTVLAARLIARAESVGFSAPACR